MKKNLLQRTIAFTLAITCALVAMPVTGLDGILKVYAEETSTEEVIQEVDSTYTDENGVTYSYYGYSDGTAVVYDASFSDGVKLVIPSTIDAYTVTKITFDYISEADAYVSVSEVTIPEGITSISEHAFAFMNIDVVNYNATNAIDVAWHNTDSYFYKSNIGTLNIGSNVERIPAFAFYQSKICMSDFYINVPSLGACAFGMVWEDSASPVNLTVGENVTTFEKNVFTMNCINVLNFDCITSSTDVSTTAVNYGIFADSTINELNIGANVTNIPDIAFSQVTINETDFTIDVESIGDKAFYKAWATDYVKLTLTDKVTFIDKSAFAYNLIEELNFNCSVTNDVSASNYALFENSTIKELNIGESVTRIPNFTFYGSIFQFTDFSIKVPEIGKYAFWGAWTSEYAANLTIEETVQIFRDKVFSSNHFTKVNYNATSAETSLSINANSPFYEAIIEDLYIADNVTVIPSYMFCYAKFQFTDLTINVPTLGNNAFASAWSSEYAANLIIGEDVAVFNEKVFQSNYFTKVTFNATNSQTASHVAYGPFYYATISNLEIGDNVTIIPGNAFYCSKFQFTDLTINVPSIGVNAFASAWSSEYPANLTLGEDVAMYNNKAFSFNYFKKVSYLSTSAQTSPSSTLGPFYDSVVSDLYIGDNVSIIPSLMFYCAKFQFTDLIVNVPTLGNNAFASVWSSEYPANLTLGEDVEVFNKKAFATNYFSSVEYNAIEARTYSSSTNPFSGAQISNLKLGTGVTIIPAYMFNGADFLFTEFEINVPIIDNYAFASVWSSEYPVNLVIGKDVLTVGNYAFKGNTCNNVYILNGVNSTVSSKGFNDFTATDLFIHSNSAFNSSLNGKYTNLTLYCEDEMVETRGTEYFDSNTGLFTTPIYNTCAICGYQETTYEYVDALTVIFMADGVEVSREYCKENGTVTAPTVPDKSGYSFAGWDTEFSVVTSDLTVNAVYEANKYTVTFVDYDGTVLDTQEVVYQSSAVAPTNPTRVGYTFKGWDVDFSNIEDNTTVTAEYDINYYTVTFEDYDGTVLDTQSVSYGSDATAPENPTREGYSFTSWSGDYRNVSANISIKAQYEINKYTVTFVDYDGTVIDTQIVEHGSDANRPSDPSRTGYTFTGWNSGFANITSDVTITAEYDINYYTVTFVDYDGTVIDTQSVAYGSNATAPANPMREGHDFINWIGDYTNITKDTTVEAFYSIKVFTVIFKVLDEIFNSQNVEYGSSAIDPGTPTLVGGEWGEWIFAGWDTAWDYITGNLVINALFTQKFNEYTVTFVDYDGTVIDTQTIEYDNDAVAPISPSRIGYTFIGWDEAFENVKSNLTITALYELNEYTVVFKDYDGSVIGTQTITHGSSAVAPENPVREGYNFIGWDGDYSNITADSEFVAVYDVKVYKVRFLDWEGKVKKLERVEHGQSATAPVLPETYGRIHIGWDTDFSVVTSNLTVNAVYENEKYTVQFVDWDGTVVKEEIVEYEMPATAPEVNPVRDCHTFTGWAWHHEEHLIYEDTVINAMYEPVRVSVTFVDWNGIVLDKQIINCGLGPNPLGYGLYGYEIENPTRENYKFIGWDLYPGYVFHEDTIITAQYELNKYTVTFVDYDGTWIETQTVTHGFSAKEPIAPTHEGYTFTGWDADFSVVTSDLEVKAVYERNKYTVQFVDWDGTVLKEETVIHGVSAKAPINPERVGYSFVGWSCDYTNISENIVVIAQYKINEYTISFVDFDGTILDTRTVTYGSSVTIDNPVRVGYTFTGWDKDFSFITENMIVTALYTINVYSVIFRDYDGTELSVQNVEHGNAAIAPIAPVHKGITFRGWDTSFDVVEDNLIITAMYDTNYYTVTFVDYDGSIINEQQVAHGGAAVLPENPTREGYTFVGWDEESTVVIKDIEIHAMYEINKYTVIFKDYDGKTLDTQVVEHGASAKSPSSPTRVGYVFAGWDKAFDVITTDTVVNAEYDINYYTVTFVDYDGTVIDTQSVAYGSDATAPENPTREGHDFINWMGDYTNITEDTTVEAFYSIKVFTVIFKVFDKLFNEQFVEYGSSANNPGIPSDVEEDWGRWVFKGWDSVWDFITGDVTINAVFEKVYNQYIVTFVDYDGTVLNTQTVVHGQSAIAPENPTRNECDFIGWDKDFSRVTSDLEVKALYHEHSYDCVVETKEATCIEIGYVVLACTCGKEVKNELPIDADNHIGETVFAGKKDATCVDKGYSGDIHCNSCKAMLTKGHDVDALGHIKGDVVKENYVEPTTTKDGSYDEVVYCKTCGIELSRKTITLPMIIVPDVYYSVVFHANGGTFTNNKVSIETSVKEGEFAVIPAIPTRDGYSFTGWYMDATGTENFDNAEITKDIIVYAGWEKDEVIIDTPDVFATVKGYLYDEKGNPIVNAMVLLHSNPRITYTDENGFFQFTDVEEGDHTLYVYNSESGDTEVCEINLTVAKEGLNSETVYEAEGYSVATGIREYTFEVEASENTVPAIFVPIAVSVGFAGGTGTVIGFLFWRRRRKVYGTVLNNDGEPMVGVRITLIGADSLETVTDAYGCFEFKNLKAGNYEFNIYDETNETILFANIHTEIKDIEEAMVIIEANCNVEMKKEKKNICLDVVRK